MRSESIYRRLRNKMHVLKIASDNLERLESLRKSIVGTPLAKYFKVFEIVADSVKIIHEGDTMTVSLSNKDVLNSNIRKLITQQVEAATTHAQNIIFDMKGVWFLNTALINMFITLRNTKRDVSLINVGKEAWRVLDLMQVPALIDVKREQ